MSPAAPGPLTSHRLRTARVLAVSESECVVWGGAAPEVVRFAPPMPSPRVERVAPGHLVAVATGAGGDAAVVWRWFDAVVLGDDADGTLRVWEPSHGKVVARRRPSCGAVVPGFRVFASAGLPGAEWWAACTADDPSGVELDAVDALYTEHELWASVFPAG